MIINTHTKLVDAMGEPLPVFDTVMEKQADGTEKPTRKETGEFIELGGTLAHLLYNAKSKNQYKSFYLSQKFAKEDEVNLKAEDITFLKETIEELKLPDGHAGQIMALLEGESNGAPEEAPAEGNRASKRAK